MLVVCLLLSVSTTYAYAAKTVIHYDPQVYRPEEKPIKRGQMIKTLVAEYEKIHPDVDIELVGLGAYGGQDYVTWIQARLLTKDAPEVFFLNYEGVDALGLAEKGWVTAWDPYLDKPNPYVSGNEHWRDIFNPLMFREVRAVDGKIYDIAADGVGVAVTYNKDIFKKAGVSVPQDWAEFMRILAKIKQLDVIPFGMTTSVDEYHWPQYIIQGGLISKEEEQLWDVDGNGRVNVAELTKAILEGTLRADTPYNTETWRLMKEFSQYWPPGFTAKLDLRALFLREKIAMYLMGSWDAAVIEQDPLRKFDWGMFEAFPAVTKESSPLGQGELCTIFGAWGGLQWHIPGYLPQQVKDIAADWCMFLSAPQNLERLIIEHGGMVPYVKGVEVPKGLEVMTNLKAKRSVIQGQMGMFDPEFGDKYNREANLFMTDEVSFDEFLSRIQKHYEDTARTWARKYPEWGIK